MTRFDTITAHPLARKDFVLATDLDGTFLGGTDAARARCYDWINRSRGQVGLIFVTGRDPEFISELTLEHGVPRPDFVIGDVGTTIAEMGEDHSISPITALEAQIASAWGDATEKVKAALADVAGLRLQPTNFRYRLSYDMDPATFDDRAFEIVAALGLDALASDNRFFDVLPKGISKGPSLLRLLDYLGIAEDRTLAAGDTLNDLSMLTVGVPAVAVGGSEQPLLDAIEGHTNVHVAKGVGVDGIAEAIRHHNLLPQS
ncbi:MAG: HAD-IIB family hydrolase [Pseudomonadota bacterium]